MADLRLGMRVLVDTPVRAFGFQRTPPFLHQETIALLAPYKQDGLTLSKSTVQLAGFSVYAEAGVMIFQVQPSNQDTTLAMVNFPSGTAADWKEMKDNPTGALALVMSNSVWNNTFDVATNASLPSNSAFCVRVGRGQPATPAGGDTVNAVTYYTVVRVGDTAGPDGSGALPYQLILMDGQAPFLQYAADDGAGGWYWGPIGVNGVWGTSVQNCSQLFEQNGRLIPINWLPFPEQNTLVVDIANGAERITLRPENTAVVGQGGVTRQYTQNLQVASGSLRVYGQNGTAQFQYLPIEFAPSGQMYSGEIDIPFQYQGNGYVSLGNSEIPSGYTVTTDVFPIDYTNTRLKYYVKIDSGSNVNVSVSPLVVNIQLVIPPTFDYTATVGSVQDISSRISEVVENQHVTFSDTSGVVIRTQVGVMFDNSLGDFSNFAGVHRAVQYERWLELQAIDGTFQPYTPPVKLLTGWTGHAGAALKADPTRQFDTVLDDNLWPLETCQSQVLTDGDGWCWLAYIRFMANMQGRNDDFIADTFKTCSFGPNPSGCNHLKLPLGTGMNPKMVPSPEGSYLMGIEEILGFVFACLWSDTNGVMQVMPYYPGIYQTPFKGSFGVSESGNPNNPDFLSSMWNRQKLRIDTKDLRTGAGFFGLDPATNMVQGTFLNIDDFVPGFTANVVGFRRPLVKVSNLFVDPAFTAAYAYAALQRMVLPNVVEEHDACFLPGLFCLDQYAVTESNELINGTIPLIVEGITSRFSVDNPHNFGSTVTGRWAYNLF